MEKVYTYYTEKIEASTRQLNDLKKKMHVLGSIRLILVLAALISCWIFRQESGWVITGILGLYALPFTLFMVYHNRLHTRKTYTETSILLNKNELKALDYDFSAFDGAAEHNKAEHSFSLDLDLFGERSLFQSLNRTVTSSGKELLVEWFLNPFTSKEKIQKRQEAITELASFTELRQHFYVTGSIKTPKNPNPSLLESLFHEKTLFIQNRLWKTLIWVVPCVWTILLAGVFLNRIDEVFAGLFFCMAFLIAYIKTKDINHLYHTVNKMEDIFSVYSDLMKNIEGDLFQAEELRDISQKLTDKNGITASSAIKQLSKYIGALDQRFSLAGILLNLFYLRDIRHALALEQWRKTYREDFGRWLNALAHFDAYSSLAGFAFNHPDYIYPQITDVYFQMEGKDLGHPLLHRDICVKNDIDIRQSPYFLVITGANMAGKSTYLRTVGVNYLLACIGAPVFATALTVYPAQLVTSLRTSDSLVSNESYFFAELKRLKMIIDRLKEGEKLFIILDEILKGTNSVDKQKGSIALMKQLVSYKACGIIATHDLVLGTLEEEFPDEIKNYRFEADIKKDELAFSYRLREGIAQNMNAYFLMKKMGITV
ncbi:DNA mismatch repair protein MutS [Parabacteroides sp. 52]|uniref:MutS-related protein n=1 Tax=unclassified Parabacteroides TaxID=2649774 RepID=UPI0013D2C427|nr:MULTISPECIES: DNA mismatch repair protein MutS [unclassified Parabacteroides]MDH6534502.1 DNA mismatch repair ATPase MutS [Parabacteroides sp. PM5-20]NDV55048.1 DNA mismatch repair protein MutS [Parabacteroides sp. 52]